VKVNILLIAMSMLVVGNVILFKLNANIYLLNSNVNIVSSCDINYLPNSNGNAYSKGNTSNGFN
jgi:hypothetical protein